MDNSGFDIFERIKARHWRELVVVDSRHLNFAFSIFSARHDCAKDSSEDCILQLMVDRYCSKSAIVMWKS